MTIDTGRAFDSMKLSFKINFGTWIKILLRNHESCIINGDSITKYFNFEKDERQFDAISVYLLIFGLDVLFVLIKKNSNIKE